MADQEVVQINIRQVLKAKLGDKARFVPGPIVKWLERTVRQQELNDVLTALHPKRGAEFCEGVFEYFNSRVSVSNPEKLPSAAARRLIFVSNHPLGGLDGLAIIAELTRHYGPGLRVVVNDILMAVKPVNDVFLPINKHGAQDRESIRAINEAMAADEPIVIFPAGLVSRKGADGTIKDLQWHKMFVNKAVEYHRDVLPIHFGGENSSSFYNLARWRKRLGIKFNIEMLYLPSELVKARDKQFTITVGDIIPWQSLRNGPEALAQANEIREIVYSLNNRLS